MSMNSKFRYIIFEDNIYSLELRDYYGNPFTVELSGKEILDQVQRMYASEEFLNELDNKKDL